MVFIEKEEASAKRDKRRCRDKKEQMQSFSNIQRKALEVQQRKLKLTEGKERTRAKEMELKEKELEARLLYEKSRIMMADLTSLYPERRAWFEKKQDMIRYREA
jgi:hypothetical protein